MRAEIYFHERWWRQTHGQSTPPDAPALGPSEPTTPKGVVIVVDSINGYSEVSSNMSIIGGGVFIWPL